MTRAVIFDIDGTLIDSVDLHTQSWIAALADFGIVAGYGEMRRQIGKGGDQLMPCFVPPATLEREGEAISAFRSDLFKREYLARVRPFPRVPELFRRVRESGSTIVVASSGKADEIDTYAHIAGIADLIDVKVSADDAARSKPAGDIFAAALARIAPVPADEAVVRRRHALGRDRRPQGGPADVGVRCGGVPDETLREAGAVAVFDDPADLLARYDETPLAPGWRR